MWSLWNKVKEMGADIWQGCQQAFNLPKFLFHSVKSPLTESIVLESFKNNITLLLLPIGSYEYYIRPALEDYLEEDYAPVYYSLDYMMRLIFMRLALQAVTNNAFNNMRAGQIEHSVEAIEHTQSEGEHGCGCDMIGIAKAVPSSGFYYLGNMATAYMLSNTPWIGSAIHWFSMPLILGQTIAEGELSRDGVCTKHRAELFSKHTGYYYGLGLGQEILVQSLNYLTKIVCNSNSSLIYFSYSNFLYPVFVAMIQSEGVDKKFYYHKVKNKQTDDEKLGTDWFYLSRVCIDEILNYSSKIFLDKIESKQKRDDLENQIKTVLANPLVKKTVSFFMPDAYSLSHFMQRKSVRKCLHIYEPKIQAGLEFIETYAKNDTFTKTLIFILSFSPNFVDPVQINRLVDILNKSEVKDAIKKTKSVLYKAKTNQLVEPDTQMHLRKQDFYKSILHTFENYRQTKVKKEPEVKKNIEITHKTKLVYSVDERYFNLKNRPI